jgi:thiol:disulfide interchange protein
MLRPLFIGFGLLIFALQAFASSGSAFDFATVLYMAFLGGIILNVMPCVFPVLSIKVLSLVNHSGESRVKIFLQGVMYTLGVLASFAVIAGLLIFLKSSGEAIGWGFQMQNPFFIAFLTYLLFLVALNLSGVFEVNFSFNLSLKPATDNFTSSFATGVLATLVATPCTAPFMATALGIAISFDWDKALMVFLTLGLGLAFPYLLLTTFPKLLSFMPRPGNWMVKFRQFLAFPMYFSVVWLLWVLMQQVDNNSVAVLMLGLVAVGFLVWFCTQLNVKNKLIKVLFASSLIISCIYPFFHISQYSYRPSDNAELASVIQYDEKKLNDLVMGNKPVFFYATAAWCITCKVNEKVALNTQAVQNAFLDNNIIQMRADWTNKDSKITQLLNAFGRDGVPLYIYFPGKDKEPVILPQFLTPNIVIEHISK